VSNPRTTGRPTRYYPSFDILRLGPTTEVAMARYEIVFEGEPGAREPVPRPGETVEIAGELWDVESVEDAETEHPQVHLAPHAAGDPEVGVPEAEQHTLPVKLAPPTSFESELVYTLNDLSTRLSGLAGVLSAYWGKGAA
jgi:hypothetical protein